ncbi:MAG: hypothetical protein ACTSQZ_00540 [Candidatus Thorarchaeota archaeon]
MGKKSNREILDIISSLVKYAYPELESKRFIIKVAKIKSYACISWEHNHDVVRVTCNDIVNDWHEAALIGLLSHELSHPASMKMGHREESTDLDVINRGLGPYLALERIITNKYSDHVIKSGRDKYLGYKSIRKHLDSQELVQLDRLLFELRLTARENTPTLDLVHDYHVVKTDTEILTNNDMITQDQENQNETQELKLVIRDNITHVYLDEVLVGKYSD